MGVIISAEDSFNEPKKISGRMFAVSVSGTFVGTVAVQRLNTNEEPAPGATWKTVATYTEPGEQNGIDAGGHWYRIGIPNGMYTSGAAVVDVY